VATSGIKDKPAAYAQQVGTDGFVLLDALEANGTPSAAREAFNSISH
jgi:hypothetical protein